MTLGGIVFIRNAIKYDYNIMETISCLHELCDEVVVLDAGSDDGTDILISRWGLSDNVYTVSLPKEAWDAKEGREKLAHFQNVALSFLSTDYYVLCQADEIIHEKSFKHIREAIETGREAFLCTRINLWGSANTYINVPENRQPCSTQIVRVAKVKYKSVDDGEGIACIANTDYLDKIKIFHYGFVRKKEVMKAKIINMQRDVFRLGLHDPKLDQSEVFDSTLWFKGDDLAPLKEPHPKFITNWLIGRP